PWPHWTSIAQRATVSTKTSRGSEATASAPDIGNEGNLAPISQPRNVAASSTTIGAFWDAMQQVWSREITPEPTTRQTWPAAVAVAFLVAAAVGLARLVTGLHGVARLRRGSVPIADPRLTELVDVLRAELCCGREVTLLECAALTTAAT